MIETINKISRELPPGWMIELCMERGAGAWINLVDPQGGYPRLPGLPYPDDRTIVEQLEDALVIVKEKAKA